MFRQLREATMAERILKSAKLLPLDEPINQVMRGAFELIWLTSKIVERQTATAFGPDIATRVSVPIEEREVRRFENEAEYRGLRDHLWRQLNL